eukprot:1568229-Pyramimonas_sp.AAC.1
MNGSTCDVMKYESEPEGQVPSHKRLIKGLPAIPDGHEAALWAEALLDGLEALQLPVPPRAIHCGVVTYMA